MESGTIIKTHQASDRIYEYTIYPVSILPSKWQELSVEINYKCFMCELQGQYYWQTIRPEYHMYYYCPRCKKVWTVNMKEKK